MWKKCEMELISTLSLGYHEIRQDHHYHRCCHNRHNTRLYQKYYQRKIETFGYGIPLGFNVTTEVHTDAEENYDCAKRLSNTFRPFEQYHEF